MLSEPVIEVVCPSDIRPWSAFAVAAKDVNEVAHDLSVFVLEGGDCLEERRREFFKL